MLLVCAHRVNWMRADNLEVREQGASWQKTNKARLDQVCKHAILPAGSIILHDPVAYATRGHDAIIATLDGDKLDSIVGWILVDSEPVKLASVRPGNAYPIAVNDSSSTKPYCSLNSTCIATSKHHHDATVSILQHPEEWSRSERHRQHFICCKCNCPERHSCSAIGRAKRGESASKIIPNRWLDRPRWRWIWGVIDPERCFAEYNRKQD